MKGMDSCARHTSGRVLIDRAGQRGFVEVAAGAVATVQLRGFRAVDQPAVFVAAVARKRRPAFGALGVSALVSCLATAVP